MPSATKSNERSKKKAPVMMARAYVDDRWNTLLYNLATKDMLKRLISASFLVKKRENDSERSL